MVDGLNNLSIGKPGGGVSPGGISAGGAAQPTTGGRSFADTLRDSIDEVTRLQRDASAAVQNLATGKSQDVTEVIVAMEKSDVAFKTLLAIRSKLMDAYDEVKNISV